MSTPEHDEAMREEFNRLWFKTLVPILKRNVPSILNKEVAPLIYIACWTSYCVGLREVSPEEIQPNDP